MRRRLLPSRPLGRRVRPKTGVQAFPARRDAAGRCSQHFIRRPLGSGSGDAIVWLGLNLCRLKPELQQSETAARTFASSLQNLKNCPLVEVARRVKNESVEDVSCETPSRPIPKVRPCSPLFRPGFLSLPRFPLIKPPWSRCAPIAGRWLGRCEVLQGGPQSTRNAVTGGLKSPLHFAGRSPPARRMRDSLIISI